MLHLCLSLLSVGASVAILDCDGPCVESQCRSPVYLMEILTMTNYEARFAAVQSGGCPNLFF